MKQLLVNLLELAIVLTTFTSCFCPVVEFANKDCIAITKQSNHISDMDAELCYFGSYKKEWNFYQYIVLDSISSLNSQQVKVTYHGKPLKYKLYCVDNEGWKETDAIELVDSTALKISIKEFMKEGDYFQVVEKDFPVVGDNIVTSIRIPTIYPQTQRFMNDSSKVYKLLKNRYNLYR